MKFTKKEIFLSLLVFIGFGALSAVIYAYTYGSRDTGYRASNGGTIEITDLSYDKGAYGYGYKVTNTSGTDQFIATKTEAEWDSLKAHTPSGIKVESINKTFLTIKTYKKETCPSGTTVHQMKDQFYACNANNYDLSGVDWGECAGVASLHGIYWKADDGSTIYQQSQTFSKKWLLWKEINWYCVGGCYFLESLTFNFN